MFFLIFVGGLVRSTGSGMGCPDWPKCFGQWIPPSDISELPTDYKTKFAVAGKEIADFDAFKTWTEYYNRLVGVLIGIFIFLTVIFSFPYLKTANKKIFWLCLLSFILVAFQAWIGAKVVSSDLAVYMVTIHMLIALVIVALLIFTITASQDFEIPMAKPDTLIKPLVVLMMFVMFVQIILGTQVREEVDEIAKRIDNRDLWLDEMDWIFYFHRSWSLINIGLAIFIHSRFKQTFERQSILYKASLAVILMMCTQTFTGAVLANFSFPGNAQSIHLTLGSLTAGLQIFIFILAFSKTTFKEENIKSGS